MSEHVSYLIKIIKTGQRCQTPDMAIMESRIFKLFVNNRTNLFKEIFLTGLKIFFGKNMLGGFHVNNQMKGSTSVH